jgi:Raf kinase inhibitor-like YbhB/YbcL family protein
MNIPITSDAFR